MIIQKSGALRTALIDYNVMKTIGDFIQSTAGRATTLNDAGEAAKTALDGY